ncbi:hypothetical protein H8356DRAFT_1374816 [Neocallimastix lanati (nom. inval.)]|nr:hypothetical protein H8356DRAFT_1374816 [Neocallimastix sp. JGI-2020a]
MTVDEFKKLLQKNESIDVINRLKQYFDSVPDHCEESSFDFFDTPNILKDRSNFELWKKELFVLYIQEKFFDHIQQKKIMRKDESALTKEERTKLIPVQGRANTFFINGTTDDDITADAKFKSTLIESVIRKRLFQYTEVDIIAERTNVFNQLTNELQNLQAQAENNQNNLELQAKIQNIQEKLIQQQDTIEEAIANDAMANSIINPNVTEKAFEKMEKLKQLYERDEEEEHSICDINNTMDVINEIMELFDMLHEINLNPNNLKKLSILHNALPNEIQNIVNFKYNSKSNRFTSLNNNYIQNSPEDNMDLDYDLDHVYQHNKNLCNSKS